MKALGSFLYALFAVTACAFSADRGVPVTVRNYSHLPVHATAVRLDEQCFGGPVRVRRADNSEAIPVSRGAEGVRLFLRLPAASRLELIAEPVDRWPDSQFVKPQADTLRNGVVRFALQEGLEVRL